MKDFIDVRRITKQYETAKALNNVSLTIPEGSLTAIVGKAAAERLVLIRKFTCRHQNLLRRKRRVTPTDFERPVRGYFILFDKLEFIWKILLSIHQ